LYKNYSLFENNDIQINDECIKHIIFTYNVEKGLRSLNRCLDTIFNRLNVLKLLGQNINKYNFSFNLKINFPYILNIKDIDILLKDRIVLDNKNVYSMYS
jgi:ATP-dependent Lon protease